MNQRMTPLGTVLLTVGDEFHLKSGKDRIIYAGMPAEDIFSIVQKKANGYQGYSWNLFFPKRKTNIVIDGVQLNVERATPDEIQFRLA
jgi:hypothetical protein